MWHFLKPAHQLAVTLLQIVLSLKVFTFLHLLLKFLIKAFKNSSAVTIKGSYASYAEEYAKANNIPFEGISAYDVGDVNMDGRIDILDATLIQKYVVGIVELSAEQKHLADYNNDGDITVIDATEIQKFIVHLN